tara:strand:+ start:1577 stop:2131 length:555 start_codon:yes stop_codon:yes gene_type:complete
MKITSAFLPSYAFSVDISQTVLSCIADTITAPFDNEDFSSFASLDDALNHIVTQTQQRLATEQDKVLSQAESTFDSLVDATINHFYDGFSPIALYADRITLNHSYNVPMHHLMFCSACTMVNTFVALYVDVLIKEAVRFDAAACTLKGSVKGDSALFLKNLNDILQQSMGYAEYDLSRLSQLGL